MIGENCYNDTLILDVLSQEKAEKIIDRLLPLDKTKFVLGIGGVSGTQKSETAIRLLIKLLEYNTISSILHLDDYYLVESDSRRSYREASDVIGIREMDKKAISQVIKDFKTGNKYPYSSLLIVEGLYALDQDCDYYVHLEGTPDSTESFRKNRKKELIDSYRKWVIKREYGAVMALKDNADLVI